MERDKSKAITKADSFLNTGEGTRCQVGPAKAIITNKLVIAPIVIGQRL